MPSYTYDPTLPTEMDDARYQLGAIPITEGDADTGLISNETIVAAIAAQGSLSAGVAYLARGLAIRFAQLPTSIRSGSDGLAWADRVKFWWELAGIVETAADGNVSPASGLLTTTAPIQPPTPFGPDANNPVYRGSPYGRRWRP